MATRKQAESALRKLVQKGSPLRAVAITGTWGCGKTHLVSAYFESAAANTLLKAAKLKYVYVSLFGLSTLQEVRRRISTVAIGRHAQKLLGASQLLSKLAAPVKAVAGVELNLAGLGETTAALLEDKVTQELVVCFDDLERASEKALASDVFGLISELIEQRRCKCIVVFNRDKLTDEAKSKGAIHEEKIFDLVLEYHPTIKENLVHGIEERDVRDIVEPVFAAFANSNVRIMRRVAWALAQFEETNVPNLSEVQSRLVTNTATLCLVKYAHANLLPSLDVLCEPTHSVAAFLGHSDFGAKVPEPLQEMLKAAEYAPSDFDECIVGLLQHGSLPETKFAEAVAKVHERQRHNAEHQEIEAIWESLRQGFTQSAGPFSKRVTDFLSRPHESIHIGEKLRLCDLLLALDTSDGTKQLVVRIAAPAFRPFPIKRRAELLKGFPEILKLGIHETEPQLPPSKRGDFNEIFQSIAGRLDSWDPGDIRKLDEFTDHEIETFILNYRNEFAIAQIRNLVSRAGDDHSASKEKSKARQDRLTEILDRIAGRDSLFGYQIKVLMPRI